jgi:hypothetical protein
LSTPESYIISTKSSGNIYFLFLMEQYFSNSLHIVLNCLLIAKSISSFHRFYFLQMWLSNDLKYGIKYLSESNLIESKYPLAWLLFINFYSDNLMNASKKLYLIILSGGIILCDNFKSAALTATLARSKSDILIV